MTVKAYQPTKTFRDHAWHSFCFFQMLLASVDLKCSDEVITIVSMLQVQNVFYRPRVCGKKPWLSISLVNDAIPGTHICARCAWHAYLCTLWRCTTVAYICERMQRRFMNAPFCRDYRCTYVALCRSVAAPNPVHTDVILCGRCRLRSCMSVCSAIAASAACYMCAVLRPLLLRWCMWHCCRCCHTTHTPYWHRWSCH